VAYQGIRFLVVAVCALAANLVILHTLVGLGFEKIPAQAIAIILVTPLNFVGNKLWSFRRR
jgi:putative flippase GtrA